MGQRARENLAHAKQSMLVEITETVEAYADMAFKTIQGGHQKIADNYLSLKAYAVAAKKAEGLAPPGATLKSVFSGAEVKVKNSVSKVNGLVNEFVGQANDCRMRWPMGLGKYLLLKLEASMGEKGVL